MGNCSATGCEGKHRYQHKYNTLGACCNATTCTSCKGSGVIQKLKYCNFCQNHCNGETVHQKMIIDDVTSIVQNTQGFVVPVFETLMNQKETLKKKYEKTQQQIKMLEVESQQTINDLQLENKRLVQNLSDLQQRNKRCYVRKEVIEYNHKDTQTIVIRDEIKEKQTEIGDAMNVHKERLEEWNTSTVKLQEQFKNEGGDDEKKEADKTIGDLLHKYVTCMKLLTVQKSRNEDVAEHVISLSKSKKALKEILKQYTLNQQSSQQRYNELSATYNNLKSQREHLQSQVENMVKEIDKITEEENDTNQQKCTSLDTMNVSGAEKAQYDELLKECKSLIAKYNAFDNAVDDKSKEIHARFGAKWIEHEKGWKQWNVDDIMCWIKYLMHGNKIKTSQELDLELVAKEMTKQKFTGKSLPNIEKNDLKLFGVTVFEDSQQVYGMIRKLVEKYPDVVMCEDGNGIEGGVQITSPGVTIPKEYLCPISNTIMMNPVVYDGVTYDRDTLTEYLEKHKKTPGSDEPYDEDENMLKNRKLKQKIDAFLSVHPNFQNEGV
eukprot:339373_1